MTKAQGLIFVFGMLSGLVLICALSWSMLFPSKRIWPPRKFNSAIPMAAWGLTLAVYASAIGLGFLDWGARAMPFWLQWIIGPLLILAGNLAAWRGAFAIGLQTTSGAKGELVTSGLYRYSRNPQYVADIAIFLGLGLLFSSTWVWPVVAVGVIALASAPLAEEPWLRAQYGSDYDDYSAATRRFF